MCVCALAYSRTGLHPDSPPSSPSHSFPTLPFPETYPTPPPLLVSPLNNISSTKCEQAVSRIRGCTTLSGLTGRQAAVMCHVCVCVCVCVCVSTRGRTTLRGRPSHHVMCHVCVWVSGVCVCVCVCVCVSDGCVHIQE